MKMEDGLSAIGIGVNDQAVAAMGNSLGLGDFAGYDEQVTQGEFVFQAGVVDRFDVAVWYEKHVGWRNGVNIAKGGHLLILVKNFGAGLPGGDFAEDTVGIHGMDKLR